MVIFWNSPFDNCSICAYGILVSRISLRFVSNVIFAPQSDNSRYMYLSYCTYQTIHSGQLEVNITKKVDNFLTVMSPLWPQASLQLMAFNLLLNPQWSLLRHPLVIHSKQQRYQYILQWRNDSAVHKNLPLLLKPDVKNLFLKFISIYQWLFFWLKNLIKIWCHRVSQQYIFSFLWYPDPRNYEWVSTHLNNEMVFFVNIFWCNMGLSKFFFILFIPWV